MAERRSWILWGPCSGGVYQLEFDGQKVYHRYSEDPSPGLNLPEEEPVTHLLARGTDPAGYGGERLRAVLPELRAALDGWYPLAGNSRIRFEQGVPREIAGDAFCADVARGGHHCGPACAGEVDYAQELPRAERIAGRPLQIEGPWRWRDHPHAGPYVAEVWAALSPRGGA